MKAIQTIHISPENAILVIVDMQNEFCKPGGKLYSEASAQIVPGVISAIHGIAEQARSVGIPVIYIQSVRTLQEPEFTIFGSEPILERGSWATDIVEELKPHKGDIIVQKSCHDPFYNTDLERVLQTLVPDPTRYYAVVTGGAIHVCVYHAVMGFHLRNYWTVVPVDSIYYISDSTKQRALEQFSEGHPYPNVFLSRSDLIEVARVPATAYPKPIPGS